jgi:hypothetical protein
VHEFKYNQPAALGLDGSLDYDSLIVHNLSIDAREDGGPRITVPATLHFLESSVGAVTKVGNTYLAPTALLFEFRTVGANPEPILTGRFGDGTLSYLFGSGSLISGQNSDGGTLTFLPGSALDDLINTQQYTFSGQFNNAGPASAAWSLAEIAPPINDGTLVPGSAAGAPIKYFPSFTAENAFVASVTAIVPSPGTLMLSGLAAGVALFRTRRR